MLRKLCTRLKQRYNDDGVWQIIPFVIEIFMCNVVRGIYFYLKLMGIRTSNVILEVNKYLMRIYPKQGGIDFDLFVFGKREVRSTDFLKTLLKPDMVVLEVGANIGYYALLEASRVKEVIAIEPVSDNISRLQGNIRLNNTGNIAVHRCALGDTDGLLPIYKDKDRCNLHGLLDADTTALSDEEVSVFTLPSFLKKHNIGDVDVIRMDIEGYEYNVICGAFEYLNNHDPLLFIELHTHKMGYDRTKFFLTMLRDCGYEVVTAFMDTDMIPFFAYREYRYFFNHRYRKDFSDYTIQDFLDDEDVLEGYYTRLLVFFTKK